MLRKTYIFFTKSADGKYFVPTIVKKKKILKTQDPISIDFLNSEIEKHKLIHVLSELFDELFDSHASREFKESLLVSYYYRYILKNNSIVNVEVSDWLKETFFKDYYEKNKKNRRIKHVVYPRDWYRSLVCTFGNHDKNIRFKNIHLSEDVINGEKKYNIHWDSHSPVGSLWSVVKHNFYDVLRTK